MAGNLRFTAAKTSIIGKRSTSNTPFNIKKLLPSQAKYQQNRKIKDRSEQASSSQSGDATKKKSGEEQLTVVDYNVQLDYQLPEEEDLVVAIDTILNNQWSESSTLSTRFHSKEMINSKTEEELLFSLPGLSVQTKADILKYRSEQLPEGLVTVNQLYSIYEQLGHTFVDRNLELRIREGTLKKFIISNASPIISRSPQKFQSGKVTYGFENVEIVVKMENYLGLIEKQAVSDSGKCDSFHKFAGFIKANPAALFVAANETFHSDDLSLLVKYGFLTLTSNHLNELESNQYAISYPNCGTYLKLVNAGRTWLVKSLSKSKYKEILESQLLDKWEGQPANANYNGGLNGFGTTQNNPKMTNFRKPYYGFDINWILADALGAGIVEVFTTPVGRGWKLTGKI